MDGKKLIAVVRVACGTAIIITSMVTGVNGTFILVGLGLLGLPIEALQSTELSKEQLKMIEKFKDVIEVAKTAKKED